MTFSLKVKADPEQLLLYHTHEHATGRTHCHAAWVWVVEHHNWASSIKCYFVVTTPLCNLSLYIV